LVNLLKILIFGVNGMLGHKLFQHLSSYEEFQVHGTARVQGRWLAALPRSLGGKIRLGVDAYDFDTVSQAIRDIRPDWVMNCIGLIKQGSWGKDSPANIFINALLPHQIARVCQESGARLLHFSTDCVFSGQQGNYTEEDFPDAGDLYGRSKLLGEVNDLHCLTLRTSIIGHELQSQLGLMEWFLAQQERVCGYTRHIYTGFPTMELARTIARYIIPHPELHGVYHLSSEPISKYDLLRLAAQTYGKPIEIEPYHETFCDRSLNSSKLRGLVQYTPPPWSEMIDDMYRDFKTTGYKTAWGK